MLFEVYAIPIERGTSLVKLSVTNDNKWIKNISQISNDVIGVSAITYKDNTAIIDFELLGSNNQEASKKLRVFELESGKANLVLVNQSVKTNYAKLKYIKNNRIAALSLNFRNRLNTLHLWNLR